MKKIILIFLFVIKPCFSQDITDTDLVVKNETYYNIYTNKPATGKVINKFSSGKVFIIKNYKQGKLHGPYERYTESGQLEEKGTYKDGKLEGIFESHWDKDEPMHPREDSINRIPNIPIIKKDSYWHDALLREKGRLKSIETYKNGNLDCPYESYHANGQLLEKGFYKNGKEEGLYVSYWNNSQLRAKEHYKNGLIEDGTYEWYWKNGQLQLRRSYKNGKLDGIY